MLILPSAFVSTLQLGRTGELSIAFILGILILIILLLIIFIVFVEKGQRRLPVQYPKRQVGNINLWWSKFTFTS